jgi:hypothetical protein
MEQLWSDSEVKRIGMHIDSSTDRSLLDEDRNDLEGMGAAAWSVVAVSSVFAILVYTALRYWG